MAKKERTRDTAADFVRRSNATSRMRSPEKMFAASPREPIEHSVGMRAAPVLPRPIPRPARGGMKSSLVPTPRPDDLMERRKAADSADAAYRESMREAQDIEMGREVRGYEAGGMVRGCKAGQMSGKGFRGTY